MIFFQKVYIMVLLLSFFRGGSAMLVTLYSAQLSMWFVTRACKYSKVCHCTVTVTWGEATAPIAHLWIRPWYILMYVMAKDEPKAEILDIFAKHLLPSLNLTTIMARLNRGTGVVPLAYCTFTYICLLHSLV